MAKATVGEENVAQYWRDYFANHPETVGVRSNDAAVAQWKADHPESTDVPQRVMNGLTNVKSSLRKDEISKPKRGRPRKDAVSPNGTAPAVQPVKLPAGLLEALEEEIDRCLLLIGGREPLKTVAQVLKQARRLTIMKMNA